MYRKNLMKTAMIAFAAFFSILTGGITAAQAFSVDVDNLQYTDTSGPREINYDFSTGAYGGSLPANTIGLPETAIFQKNAADLGFAFGVVPDVGIATLSAPLNGVATLATSTEGAAILQGSSSTAPPAAAASWTFSLALKNFAGVTDAAKRYRFEIGAAVPPPASAGLQPRFWGEWDSSGNLSLQAIVKDDNGVVSFASQVAALTGLTPTAASIELKIDNNTAETGKVVFSYRANGAVDWTVIGTYTIPTGVVFKSLPANFPYLYIKEGVPESPFRVHSQHWYNNATPENPNDTVYNAWLTVDDPGQTAYSAVSVSSTGYLFETEMIFNNAGGYWEIPASVFADNFDDNSINATNWTASGNSVSESEGVLKVTQGAQDAGGKVLSRAFQINPYAPIVVQRKAKVHYANDYFDGAFALFFDDNPAFTTLNETQMSVFASHAHYSYATTGEQTADGFYLGRYAAHFTNPTAKTTTTPWDTWFEEKIVYDPASGDAELYINGVLEATINVGALPSGATYMKLYIDAWGWYTGHSNDSDDLSVSQKYSGTPVHLSYDTPPAAGSVVFNFTATKKAGGTEVVSQPVTGYVEPFATITGPPESVSTNPVFTWTGIPNARNYAVEVNDTNWNRVWSFWDIAPGTTSVAYNIDGKAPALENGKTYNFNIISTIETGGQENDSFAQGSFTYTGSASTISFSGSAVAAPNWPSTDGATPVSGAMVMAMPVPDGMTYGSTTTGSDGTFTVSGIPASPAVFRLVLQHPDGDTAYPFVLSKLMSWNEPIEALLPFVFLTADQYAGFGNATGTGMILGRVAMKSSPTTSFLPGATITARPWDPLTQSAGSTTYDVTYSEDGTSTDSDGVYYVKNVPDGAFVQLVATLDGYAFDFNATSIILVQEGRISEDSFFATPVSAGGVSFSGVLMNEDGTAPVGGAPVQMAGNSMIATTTESTKGAFTLAGLPSDTLFSVKMSPPSTMTDYVPTYSQSLQMTSSITAARSYNLYRATDLTTWGTATGTAVIHGRVMNANNLDAGYVSGAVVGYTSSLGNTNYRVMYVDASGTPVSGTGTYANGKFMILDVAESDMVTVWASNGNYQSTGATAFGNTTDRTHANSVYQGPLKVSPVSNRVAVGGRIMNTADPAAGIGSVVVEEVGSSSPVNATVSNGDGSFYMTVPSNTPVQVKFEKGQDTTLAPTYTGSMQFSADALALGDYNLFTKTTLADWGVTDTTGIIRSRVKDASGNRIGGAVVSYTSAGGNTYQICYDDACSTSLTSTDATTGRYIIKGVWDNDIVTVTATKAGYTFNTRIFPAHGGAMHQGSITGTPDTNPVVTGLSHTSGLSGASVTISGNNFGDTQGTGKVLIGGYSSGVQITSWSNTSITVTTTRSGTVTVVNAAGVSSNPSTQSFQITSSYFNADVVNPEIKVIKNDKAEFIVGVPFYNGFTTSEGITLDFQGTNAATLNGAATFIPGATLVRSGGVSIRIDTSGLAAGTYTANLVATSAEQTFDAGTLTLKVVTVKNIKFYEMVYDSVNQVSNRVDLTSKTGTSQGQLNIFTEVIGSDDEVITDDVSGSGTGVVLSEIPAQGSVPILGVYKRFWGYDIYAGSNGSTTLRATTPDGTYRDLPIMVNFPTDSYVDAIGFTAPDGTGQFPAPNTVYNNRTDPITWYASGKTTLGWIGNDTSGLTNFSTDFLDKLEHASGGLSATSTFNLTNPPLDIGTAIFHASTYDGKASAYVPLTTINDPATGLLAFYIRSLDSNAFAEYFKIYFYGASDGLFKFARDVYAMHIGSNPVLVGNIPPGSYKILFAPGNTGVKPQWWPNAAEMASAEPVTFTAGGTVGDIYFFAQSQPSGATVALPTTPGAFTMAGGNGQIAVDANDPALVWFTSSNASWITITSPATGTGDGIVTFTVAENTTGVDRTGTLTVNGQNYTINQAGTLSVRYGYAMIGNGTVTPSWYHWKTELGTADISGSAITTTFKESADLCPDANYCMQSDTSIMPYVRLTPNKLLVNQNTVFVGSSDGNLFLPDFSGSSEERGFAAGVKLNPQASYTKADVAGEYFSINYERDLYGVNRGQNRVSTEIVTSDGAGALNSSEKLACNGTDCTGGYLGPYAVTRYYDVQQGGVLRLGPDPSTLVIGGYISADGKVMIASNPTKFYPGTGDDFMVVVSIKKGDKAYSSADLQGEWTLSMFGDEAGTAFSEFGSMTCDASGVCTARIRRSTDGGGVTYRTDSINLGPVAADGSINGFHVASEKITGAIGSNGNVLLLTYTEANKRKMGVAIKVTHPEAAAVKSRFEAMMGTFNANDFDTTDGFPTFVSEDFLDEGENKAVCVAEAEQERTDEGEMSWTIRSVTGSGNIALVNVVWGDGENDTLPFRWETDRWMFYGNQKKFDVWGHSGRQVYPSSSEPYWVSIEVRDPVSGTAITGVNVKGPGLPTDGVNLYHNTTEGRWQTWSMDYPTQPNLNPVWGTRPVTPLYYYVTVTETGGATTERVIEIKSFVEVAPAVESISPAAGSAVSLPLTFSWASAGDGYRYRIELMNANYERIWESDKLSGTSVTYSGTLAAGSYFYNLTTMDAYENMSMIQVPFAVAEQAFTEEFSATTLDAPWANLTGPGSISLTDNSGYLRYILEGPAYSGNQVGVPSSWTPSRALVRSFVGDDWVLTTTADYHIKWLGTGAQYQVLTVAFGEGNNAYLSITRGTDQWYGTNILQARLVVNGQVATENNAMIASDDVVTNDWLAHAYYYEIRRNGRCIMLRYSADGTTFKTALTYQLPEGTEAAQRVIIDANVYSTAGSYVDWDYMRVATVPVPLYGDLNNDQKVDAADAVLALQVLVGLNPAIRIDYETSCVDVDCNRKVGPAEVLYILQEAAGLRP